MVGVVLTDRLLTGERFYSSTRYIVSIRLSKIYSYHMLKLGMFRWVC